MVNLLAFTFSQDRYSAVDIHWLNVVDLDLNNSPKMIYVVVAFGIHVARTASLGV